MFPKDQETHYNITKQSPIEGKSKVKEWTGDDTKLFSNDL